LSDGSSIHIITHLYKFNFIIHQKGEVSYITARISLNFSATACVFTGSSHSDFILPPFPAAACVFTSGSTPHFHFATFQLSVYPTKTLAHEITKALIDIPPTRASGKAIHYTREE
jgi:hypothetical protein